MASIKLTSLENKININNNPNGYTYVDMHFDIEQDTRSISNTNNIQSINGKDITADYDEAAIKNSIYNILHTRPGQRFLLPLFGCDLLRYIGVPVTTDIANELGRTILRAIETWENRVTIDEVYVIAKAEQHEYDITITLTIPTLKKKNIKILSVFTNNGLLEST